ncbi:hypothetical protein LIER_35975 [Lithospermum erythrorhizon]|uniref:Uncharacterized protein n=1 Tax=Lithospermum erythrorhizon TaxID=34254 RepID=A0AAV3P3J4_LITER
MIRTYNNPFAYTSIGMHCDEKYERRDHGIYIVKVQDTGLDQRLYNKPTSTEVAGIWIEDEYEETNNVIPWDIRVYTKPGHSHRVQYYYACYNPLQLVFMFPKGEPGWHGNILRVGVRGNSMNKISFVLSGESYLSNCSTFEEVLEQEKEGAQYNDECFMVADTAKDYAQDIENPKDGKSIWIFDIHDTLLSNLPYYTLADASFG